ncbi:hypothetical protein MASR1M101_41450 [Gemmatimonas sp.]
MEPGIRVFTNRGGGVTIEAYGQLTDGLRHDLPRAAAVADSAADNTQCDADGVVRRQKTAPKPPHLPPLEPTMSEHEPLTIPSSDETRIYATEEGYICIEQDDGLRQHRPRALSRRSG